MNSIKKTDHYYLIDGSGYIFRAYYALPPLTRKSDGLPTGAVSGFCSMLYKLLEDAKSADNEDKPTHFAVVFDAARKNFRNDIYVDYKANRGEAPEDLIPQFEYFRKSVEALSEIINSKFLSVCCKTDSIHLRINFSPLYTGIPMEIFELLEFMLFSDFFYPSSIIKL